MSEELELSSINDSRIKDMSPPPTNSSDAKKAALSSFFAGIFNELLFYGLDSYKVLRQANKPFQFQRLYRGALPISFGGTGISFPAFFYAYNKSRDYLEFGPQYEALTIPLSSAIGGLFGSIAGVPADVMKKRMVLDDIRSTTSLAKNIYSAQGLSGFFVGWKANVTKDVPFSIIKMSLYEMCAKLYVYTFKGGDSTIKTKDLGQMEAAVVGFVSGASTALMTAPLDCVNTRIKSGELEGMSLIQAHREIIRKDGFTALFRGLAPRSAILGLGSTLFWYIYAGVYQVIP